MTTKPEGRGVKALVVRPLKKHFFLFAASLIKLSMYFWCKKYALSVYWMVIIVNWKKEKRTKINTEINDIDEE